MVCANKPIVECDIWSNSTNAPAEWMKECRAYRDLLRSKREQFWTQKIESEKSSRRQLWSSIDALLGRGATPQNDKINAEQFHHWYFDEKVTVVWSTTSNSRQLMSCLTVSRQSTWMKQWQLWKLVRINHAHWTHYHSDTQGCCWRYFTIPCWALQ